MCSGKIAGTIPWMAMILAGLLASSVYGSVGRWETYQMIHGLPNVDIWSIGQDRHGNIWFGTGQGVSQYDGESFQNYSTKDGLVDSWVLAVTEDSDGNMWFGTYSGVSRFDGKTFQNYSVKEGLAGSTILSILEDSSGTLWFATSGGVSKFDGTAFSSLTMDDGLLSNRIYAIFEDEEGRLWFGTSAGVSVYNGEIFRHFTTEDGLIHDRISTILQDRDGNLWFGTGRHTGSSVYEGVSRFDGSGFQNFTTEHGLAHNGVNAICQDEKGHLWFGTYGGGVSEYDGDRFRNYTTDDGLADDRVMSILIDREGILWFGTYGGGVSKYDRDFQTFTTQDGLSESSILSLFEDADGNLWIGTGRYGGRPGAGVCKYDGTSFEVFTSEDGLADNSVYAIAEDHRGNLWLGTRKGVSRFDGTNFQTFTAEDGLTSDFVNAITHDRYGNIWFGTGGGVNIFDGERLTLPGSSFPFLGYCINFRPGPDGYTVIRQSQREFIQTGQVLPLLDDDSYQVEFEGGFTFPFFAGTYSSVFVNSDGNLTFGAPDSRSTPRDLTRFLEGPPRIAPLFQNLNPVAGGQILVDQSEKKVTVMYDSVPDFQEDHINSFQVSLFADGQIEFVFSEEISARGGIVGISPGQTTTLHEIDYLADLPSDALTGAIAGEVKGFFFTRVEDILEDSAGNIWFATYGPGHGVYKYGGRISAHLTTEDGLIDNDVWRIFEDGEKRLWIGTGNGVSILEEGRFRTVLEGNIVRDILQDKEGFFWFATNGNGVFRYDGTNFQHITTRNGLADNLVRALLEDSRGNLWFGTGNGLTEYIPPRNKILPLVRITQVIADRSYTGVRKLSLTSSTKQIAIEYKGISSKTPASDIRYTYKLDGFDSDWIGNTKSGRVFYADLEPGAYRFLVRSIDRDLNYSKPASLSIAISSLPFYRSDTFTVILSIAVGIFLCVSVILSIHRLQASRAEKLRLQHELEDARQIQLSLLPKESPQMAGYEIAGTSLPAKEVSGDFYTYLSLGENTGFVLADVTGKSVKAAMVAAMTSGMLNEAIKMQSELWNSPMKILSELNTGLQPHLIRGMYTAMSLGILNPDKKHLTLSNAGMPYPIVKRGKEVWELEVNGMPLGLMTGAEYTDLSVSLEAGDFIILCSDGVIEAENEAGEMYQTESLLEVVKQADSGISAQEMVDLIVKDVTEFIGDVEPSDDITVVALRYIE
jgi:ligand-binding sensor domain-containing protein/serine phosphatase RsbU (regulator of sigma subunit)